MFSGCSGDKKNNVTNGSGSTPVYSFEGTWKCEMGGIQAFFKFTDSDVIHVYVGFSVDSWKGTVGYNSTHINISWTHTAAGNALTESVTWSDSGPSGSMLSYSFIDEDHIDIDGMTFTRIS